MEIVVLLVAFVLIIYLQSWIYKKYAFANITYSCVLSKTEVFEGEEIELVETIVNGKLLPVPWLKAEITASRWLEFADPQSIITDTSRFVPSFFMLKGYQKITRKWHVTWCPPGRTRHTQHHSGLQRPFGVELPVHAHLHRCKGHRAAQNPGY